ncbi:MAG TPA: tetratricopeptide repeat protein [Phycisphaerae bacterium]|nr:tetratricopeptide repeat protein [Phycisphaerae bacterium]
MHRFPSRGGGALCYLAVFLCTSVRGMDGDASGEALLQSYYAANGFLQRGLYDLAAAEYRSFLRDHGDHEKAAVARYGLAVCFFRTGKQTDAASELEQLAEVKDFAFAADVLTMLGQCKLAAGDYDAAVRAFERVLDDYGDHKLAAEAGTQLAEALFKAGKFKEARARCKAALQRWPEAPQIERVCLIAAMAEMARTDYAEAAPHLEKLLTAYPKSANRLQAELLLAQCWHQLGRPDEAGPKYREVLKAAESPLRPDALYGLAALVLQKGDYAEAGRLLDELIEKHPESSLIGGAFLLRGRAAYEAKSFDSAVQALERAATAAPNLADESAYWIAKCELRQDKFEEAARRLKKALEAHPESKLLAEMTYDRAVALGRAGELGLAIGCAEKFVTRFEEHSLLPEALELLATLLHQSAKYEASQERCDEFLKRLASNPRAGAVAFIAAENEFLQKRYAEAAARYRKFLDQFPKDENASLARYRLGMSLHYSGKVDDAAPFLAEAAERVDSDPRVRPALFALANAAFDRGEWKSAEEWFGRFLEKPVDRTSEDDALLRLGLALARQKRGEEAVKAFDRLLAESPASPHRLQAIFERGQALLELKRTDDAKEAFEEVLAEGADSRFAPYARNHLGALALQSGDAARADELLAEAVENAPTPELAAEALFHRGAAQAGAQDFKTASETFGKFLKAYPDHPFANSARAQRAIALAREKKFDAAMKLFDRVQLGELEATLRSAAQYERAWCLSETGKKEEAASVYRQLAADKAAGMLRLHAMLELASQEAAAKRFEPALELLGRLQQELAGEGDPTGTLAEQVAFRRGLWQFESGRYAEAGEGLGSFVKSFEKSPLQPTANYYAGEAFFQAKRYERAAEHFDRAMRGDLEEAMAPSALLRQGEVQAQLQRWAKSEETFDQYLRDFGERDGWYQAVFGLGWARENQGRHDEAIKAYRDVVARHKGPTAARAQFQIGECLFAKKQYEEAVRELLKVDILYDYPEWSAAALYEAGRCFTKLAKSAEARAQFKTVVEKYGDTQWSALAAKQLAELATNVVPGHTSG